MGRQEGAEVGYHPRDRGQRSYPPLLSLEANSTPRGATPLRPADIDPHRGTGDRFRGCWSNLPAYLRQVWVRADAGFYHDAFRSALEDREAHSAVVAQVYPPWKRLRPGITYDRVHPLGARGEGGHGARPGFEPRRHLGARRRIETSEAPATLFALGRYPYRCRVTISISALPASRPSPTVEPPSQSASLCDAKISHGPASLPAASLPTLSPWKSSGLPTICFPTPRPTR